MAYENNTPPKTYVRETRTTQSSGPGMALLVGGLVVAVGFIFWIMFSAAQPVSPVPADNSTNTTVEPAAPTVPTVEEPVAPTVDTPAVDTPTPQPDDGAAAPAAPANP